MPQVVYRMAFIYLHIPPSPHFPSRINAALPGPVCTSSWGGTSFPAYFVDLKSKYLKNNICLFRKQIMKCLTEFSQIKLDHQIPKILDSPPPSVGKKEGWMEYGHTNRQTDHDLSAVSCVWWKCFPAIRCYSLKVAFDYLCTDTFHICSYLKL